MRGSLHSPRVTIPPHEPPVRGVWPMAAAATAPLALDIAFPSRPASALATVALVALCAFGVRSLARTRGVRRVRITLLLAMAALAVARALILYRQLRWGIGVGTAHAAATYDLGFFAAQGVLLLVTAAERRVQGLAVLLLARPGLLLTASFAAATVIATFLLSMPFAVHRTVDISVLDALFTATSAVCVTGLSVNDVGGTYTFFGQAIVLFAMQFGGIGIMTVSALALGRATGLEMQARYAAMMDARTLGEMRALVRSIVIFTLAIEAVGVGLLFAVWHGDPNVADRGGVVWNAVFHSVAAFTNGSFSLFATSMTPWRGRAGVQVVLMVLIVLGGIGFPVMRELLGRLGTGLRGWMHARRESRRLSSATRVSLAWAGILVVVGAGLFAILETGHLARTLSIGERVLASFFVSVTARTAGFSTIDFGALRPATLLVVIVLMFIGGSPGSCAGGIKTTTAAVLVASLTAELRGHEPRVFGRAIAPAAMRRAIAVTTISTAVVLAALLLLTLTEDHGFLALAFESVSAYATVGLSTGITPRLSAAGKLIVVATMFVGRVGPLTMALAIADDRETPLYRLPREGLPIG